VQALVLAEPSNGVLSVVRPSLFVVVDGDAHHRFVSGSPLDDFEGETAECRRLPV
jgi:hypothetical protein